MIYITISGTWETEQGEITARGTYPVRCSEQEAALISELDLNEVLGDYVLDGNFDQDPWVPENTLSSYPENPVLEFSFTMPDDPGVLAEVDYDSIVKGLIWAKLIKEQA